MIMRSWKVASLLACCAVAMNLSAQDEGRRATQGNTPQQPGVGAQADQQEGRGIRRGGGMMRGGMMLHDRDMAMLLMIGNKGEIEMANHVQAKLTNDQSKQFAQQMIKDHTEFLQKLQAVGGRQGEGPAGNTARAQEQPAPTTIQGQAGQRQGGVQIAAGGVDVQVGGGQGVQVGAPGAQGRSFYAPGMNPFISIKQEIAQECLAMAKKDLDQKQGVEVDKCYIGTQIVKHQDMIAQLTVCQRHSQDSQFKELCATGLQTAQHHLEMAKGIMKQLEGQKSGQ
jgi:predicted outer membrane protein